MNKKNPQLKIRYARGLGDFIACILHSKPIGWFVHFITGYDEPCKTCSQRIQALNILFPIPFWKLYFKNEEVLFKNLTDDLVEAGYKVKISKDEKEFSAFKDEVKNENDEIDENNFLPEKDKYTLISSGENYVGDFIIKVEIHQKN